MADNELATSLKFLRGDEAKLPADKSKGQVYFAYKNVGTAEKPSYTGAIYMDAPIGGAQTRVKMTANADIANYANKANLDTNGNPILGYLRTATLAGNANTQTFTFSAPSGSKYNLTLNGVTDTQAGLVTSGNQTFPGYKTLKLRAKPSATVGSNTANTSGWYKVATCTMSGWGNANILYYIRNGYNQKAAGILNFEMRSNNTSIANWACDWLVRSSGLSVGTIRVVISGMTWTMYAYQSIGQYGRVSITELSNTNIDGDSPSWNITYYNSSTKETTEPSSAISSVDGGQVYLANKATFDVNSQNIVNTYIKSLAYSTDGKQLIATRGSGDTSLKLSLPIASATKAGIVTTDTQTFGGTKTFATINTTNLNITGASGFNYSGIETVTGNTARPVWFAYDGVNGKPVINTNFTYNPSTQTLTVANLLGTADKANKDASGQEIRGTYIKNISVNGTTLTITKGSNATSTITLQDLNNKVTQTAVTAKDYTNWRTVLWGASNNATEGFTPTTVTDGTYTSNNLSFQPSTGTLKATIFKGSLNGNASTASSATKATYDGGGTKEIRTYVSDVAISGRTITVTRGNGNTFTLTTQDTNTWRGIQDNLTSDSTTDSLSAAQGKYLKSLIDGKSNNGHNHDDRYYTETEIDNKLKTYVPLAGGTMTGALNFQRTSTDRIQPNQQDIIINGIAESTAVGSAPGIGFHIGNKNWGSLKFLSDGSFRFYNGKADGYNSVYASNFYGALKGNADTATNATNANKASNDSSGNSIVGTYFSSVKVDANDSHKYNFLSPNGTTKGSITIYDEFQKRSTVTATTDWNTLIKTGIYKVQITTWGDATKMHSPNSYNAQLYSCGILLVFESVSNDTEKRFTQIFIPHNAGINVSGSAYKRMHNGSDTTTGWQDWHPIARGLNWSELTGKPNYAGSGSAGGAATSANKLNTDAGSSTRPVYFSNGIPVICDTTIANNISGNANTSTLLRPYYTASTLSTGTSSWRNGVTEGKVVWGQLWKDTSISNDTGDLCLWINKSGTNTVLNMTLDGSVTAISGFNGDLIKTTPQLCASSESNEITIKINNDGIFKDSIGTANASLRNGLDFKWYNTNWQVGNIRGSSTDSLGFGFAFKADAKSTLALKARIDTNGVYHGGVDKLATPRTITLDGLGRGSVSFDGSKDVTIKDVGYGCSKYVTQNTTTAPYYRIAYYSNSDSYQDASMIFSIDSGYNGGGFGIIKVSFRNNNITTANQSSCEVKWLARQGFSANQIFVKGNAPAGGDQYADLYFKATGTYQAVTIRVLSAGGRGSMGRSWTFEEGTPRAATDIRTYSYTVEGSDSGIVYKASITDKLTTARTITLAGAVTGSVNFDGSANVTLTTSVNHTHNYAGSSSAGGSANSAVKLDTATAGSSTQPVYFTGGKPVACTYTLSKSVPADAKFTDTNTWRGIQNNVTSDSTSDSLSAAQGKYLKGLIDGKAASNHGHNIIGLPRVTKDANTTAQNNTFKVEEFSNGTNYNLPSNHWYHIYTGQGDDANYATQLALGMTTTNIAYRVRNGSATTWGGWNTIIHSGNYTSYTVTKTGSGASGTWGINVSGSSTSCTGNAATATKLQTARTISLTGSVTGSGTFDGSGNLSITTSTNHSHSQYLPLAGGTMTGTINFNNDVLACNFRANNASYRSGVMHQSSGNEALVFAAANAVTSFIFKCGKDPVGMSSSTWTSITPSMQIKNQSVYINSLIANGTTPSYNLYVNGSTRCNGTLGVGTGSSAEIDFFPNSSSTIGAKIVAYSDRIEFVFV